MRKLSKHFNIAIAGLVIEINTVSLSTSLLCYDFICEGDPDLSVWVTIQDVEHEKELDAKNNKKLSTGHYETIAVHRKIVDAVIPFDVFLIHGAAIGVKNKAILFTAPSKTGKTTHIKKWLQNVDDTYVINGDKPLIRMTDLEAIVCGTPWAGSEQYYTDRQVSLAAIVIMERYDKNEIEEIAFTEAYPFLLQQTYLPIERDKAKKVLTYINKLNGLVHIYRFRFNNFAEDCLQVAYDAIMGKLYDQ